ncbi:MAG: methylated-DNA--[protein]-cysteine S-methyltransferase [Turicibacter sp.]|nr:methylated-DNA--[protein]-cysteine S-methyltransferase [Turicibacter sp.]
MEHFWHYETPIGWVTLVDGGAAITGCYFGKRELGTPGETGLIKEAHSQLLEFLRGKRQAFDLPLDAKGTPFQMQVWDKLGEIPYGQTRSYQDIANAINNPKAVRAVGMANNKNPISIFIPCHRVIGSNGKLVGYGGGLPLKERLLDLEREAVL